MLTKHDLSPWFRGKAPDEQSPLAQAIITASCDGRFPLSHANVRLLSAFVVQLHDALAVDDSLMLEVGEISAVRAAFA